MSESSSRHSQESSDSSSSSPPHCVLQRLRRLHNSTLDVPSCRSTALDAVFHETDDLTDYMFISGVTSVRPRRVGLSGPILSYTLYPPPPGFGAQPVSLCGPGFPACSCYPSQSILDAAAAGDDRPLTLSKAPMSSFSLLRVLLHRIFVAKNRNTRRDDAASNDFLRKDLHHGLFRSQSRMYNETTYGLVAEHGLSYSEVFRSEGKITVIPPRGHPRSAGLVYAAINDLPRLIQQNIPFLPIVHRLSLIYLSGYHLADEKSALSFEVRARAAARVPGPQMPISRRSGNTAARTGLPSGHPP